jgi:hypothetical protein
MQKKIILFFLSLILLFSFCFAQNDSLTKTTSYKKTALISSTALVGTGSLFYLNQVWYKNYNTGKFHFFNDNAEWLQMDKVGHIYTTYQISRLMINGLKQSGFSHKKQLFIGGSVGLLYMTAIECMDGFSNGWGFSVGDQIANFAGTSLAIAQHAFWKEQRIQLKFSYAKSGLAKYNPNLLGNNFYTQILKDYNAQTIWLSINPSSFFNKKTKLPAWLNISLGYGAYGMIGAQKNNLIVLNENGNLLEFERKRQYYFSFDVDLSKIKTKSKHLKTIFNLLNIIKIPGPTLEFNKHKTRFYFIYY